MFLRNSLLILFYTEKIKYITFIVLLVHIHIIMFVNVQVYYIT